MKSMYARLAASLLLAASALLSLAANGLPLPTVKPAIGPIETGSGLVAGKVLDSGVRAWFGVPFAQSPVRELRWREPQPIHWDGVYNADRFAPMCMQSMRGSAINHYFGHEGISEDCLYLNVWAPPGSSAGDELPVVVWIYGGGFGVGSAGMSMYYGESLAQKGAVYVSIAYRVGALGFMAHPELTAESPHHASGNYGLLDQVAGLQWIHDNIEKFGGDPNRVTIMGQSAGSMSVSALQASPLTEGLVDGVVGMSFSAFDRFGTPLEEAEKSGLAFQEALGADSIAAMRNIAADRILAERGVAFGLGPIRDGYFMPETMAETFAEGKQHDVPVMIGFTRDEGFSAIARAKTLDEYRDLVGQAYGDKAGELLQLYPAANDEQARRAARDIARDSTLGTSMWAWADAQSEYGKQPAYVFMFSRVHPYTPGVVIESHDPATVGAYHTADVPYWLQTLDSLNLFRQTRTYTDYDRELADLMSDAIMAFARSGDPSTDTLQWPAFSPNDPRIVEFGRTTDALYSAEPWPNAEALLFFQQNPPAPIQMGPAPRGARD